MVEYFYKLRVMLNKIIYWVPRVLSVLFVAFLSLFALDVFGEYQGIEVLLPLLMHLLPSIVMLIIVIVAWKYELVGAVIFVLAAVGYVWLVGLDRHWSWYVAISGPSLVVGILYLMSWQQRRASRRRVETEVK